MHWFKNALIYQLTQSLDWENLEEQLQECVFTPCGSADVSHFGWSAPLATSENLAHQANGKILLVAKREEKILPTEVVNRELNKRITALEEKEQRKLKKVERASLKDDVTARFDADFVLMASVLGKTVDSLIKEFGWIKDRL